MGVGSTGAGSVKLFIKIGTQPGESSFKPWAAKNYSDIDSFSMNGTASWSFTSGKSAHGDTSFSGVTVTRSLVGATPILAIACLKEKQAELVEVAVGNETAAEPMFSIRLKGEVRITKHSISGAAGADMTETITFTAPILEIEHKGKSKKDDIDWTDIKQKNDKY